MKNNDNFLMVQSKTLIKILCIKDIMFQRHTIKTLYVFKNSCQVYDLEEIRRKQKAKVVVFVIKEKRESK